MPCSFLGAGVQRPYPTWGGIISDGRELFVTGKWWLVTIPGVVIALLVVGVNLLGDGLRDRIRRAKAETGLMPSSRSSDLVVELMTRPRRRPRRRRRQLPTSTRARPSPSSASPARASRRPRWPCCACCPTTSPSSPASAQIDGQDVVGSRKHIGKLRGRSVALIPQDPMTALNPIATVGRQMVEAIRHAHPSLSQGRGQGDGPSTCWSRCTSRTPSDAVEAYPHELSGGMLQRVLIAMALSTEPGLIVADEPTSALDVTVQAGILDLLLEMQERTGVALLLITHDLGVARLMSDRIHVMHRGRFVEGGPVEQVVDHPQHDVHPERCSRPSPSSARGTTPRTRATSPMPSRRARDPEPAGIPATNGGPRP